MRNPNLWRLPLLVNGMLLLLVVSAFLLHT